MGFWIFMLVMDLLIPLTMILFGRYFLHHAPKEIQAVFGYRTTMSMKNKDTWEFAHHHCGKLWWRIGWIILVPTILAMLCTIGASQDVIGVVGEIVCVVQLLLLVWSIFPTERALKQTFDADGNRKSSI